MPEHWLGIVVSGNDAVCVHLECGQNTPSLVNQFTWSLQAGDRAAAFATLFERLKDYVQEQHISNVAIKASAVGQNRPTLSHLYSAELRGIVSTAAKVGGANVIFVQKAVISRTFGSRKADDYIKDDTFWGAEVNGDVAKTRREAALLVLSLQGES